MRTSLSAVTCPEVAVVEIDSTGRGTLHLGGAQVDHLVAAQPEQVMSVLLDYAAAAGRDLVVVTWRWRHTEMYEIRPNGTVAAVVRESPAQPRSAGHKLGQRQRRVLWEASCKLEAVSARVRSRTATAPTVPVRWSANYGQALMLGVLVLLLIGSVGFLVIAPHLWLER